MNQFFKDTLPPVLMILAIYFTVCGFIWAMFRKWYCFRKGVNYK